MSRRKHTNALVNESSPYLLQHAHNPVNWYPWGDEAFEKARSENRLILVSIGYAACHWCHVMEHECFEDEEVAREMNDKYVCIKVDREERPDVDHYYMTAVHLTGGQGGWPLNCIALPDGRPLWGGTYFPKENWLRVLDQVFAYFNTHRDESVRYADELSRGISKASLVTSDHSVSTTYGSLTDEAVSNWKQQLDNVHGGRRGHPKFPMPANLEFLLHYGRQKGDNEILDHIWLTLDKMAMGGIYDQAGGGFARYSVDGQWKVPHFEKMLYDNAQLISICSKAFKVTGSSLYREVVYETVDFLEREMMYPPGAFYSSLDADSEGEEGRFYVWQKDELRELMGADFELFAGYYNVNAAGHWEQGNHILLRTVSDDDFASAHGISTEELRKKVTVWKSTLLERRVKRVRPGLDDKTLASWNALVIEGLCVASSAFGDARFLEIAERTASFLAGNMITPEGAIFHAWKKGRAYIRGFLEDYSLVISSFIALYSLSGNERWLTEAERLTGYAVENFYNRDQKMFLFSERNRDNLISNHFQTEDNVIPSSNSVMAMNLFLLGSLFARASYSETAREMAQKAAGLFAGYPSAHANWGRLLMVLGEPFFEVVVTGDNARDLSAALQRKYLPGAVIVHSTARSESLPLFRNRVVEGKTLIYVCTGGTCRLPVEQVSEALGLMG